jgi:hypothetical protein
MGRWLAAIVPPTAEASHGSRMAFDPVGHDGSFGPSFLTHLLALLLTLLLTHEE